MFQSPAPGSRLLRWAGDSLTVTLELDATRKGRAVFRTNLGNARVHRREQIAHTESGAPLLERDWHDIPMRETAPGRYRLSLPLTEVGVFRGKACFFPDGADAPLWPEGDNLRIKVAPAHTATGNTVYTAFVRQFGPSLAGNPRTPGRLEQERALDEAGYTVIPPSGTFRGLARRLDTIMGTMRFRILQLLPIHPTPTVYARMGRYGSPFASLDFLAVNPELAEFDTHATPLDQFRELLDAVHARDGYLYLDLPANHTGWAATLQAAHPDWYKRTEDGAFASPGAWGVVWADLVELDFRSPRLRAFMADVFLYWCRIGVDGFRCDAGYMIPAETWTYIVARVREEFPDTVFLLEGLGGPVETTRLLLEEAGLDWAYSELFQTMDRRGVDGYLPGAIALAEQAGPLIHFAETHDNNRLAASGETFARMRLLVNALFSHQGAFGMANGVEWLATEKIDVHGASSLNWGTEPNFVERLARVNTLLATHPAFGAATHLRLVQTSTGEAVALLRETPDRDDTLLVLANLDAQHAHKVSWNAADFPAPGGAYDLLGLLAQPLPAGTASLLLEPGQVVCLAVGRDALVASASDAPPAPFFNAEARRRGDGRDALVASAWERGEPPALAERRTRLMLLRAGCDPDKPVPLAASIVPCNWPNDTRRTVPVPHSCQLLVAAPHPFRLDVPGFPREQAVQLPVEGVPPGTWCVLLPATAVEACTEKQAAITVFAPEGARHDTLPLLFLPPLEAARVRTVVGGDEVRADYARCTGAPSAFGEPRRAFTPYTAVLSNETGAAAQVRAAWPCVRSQYDALLALNLDPAVPVDRTVFWTRCRAWLVRAGFSYEINVDCLHAFRVDPSGRFAEWTFRVPCGFGRWVPITFTLALASVCNAARLRIARLKSREPDALSAREDVRVILRPDIEWRSFHQPTKAFTGPENEWPAAVQTKADGFSFYEAAMRIDKGGYHAAPEWTYMVPHVEEEERGLDAAGDLFSPGWFETRLSEGGTASLTAGIFDAETAWPDTAPAPDTLPLTEAVAASLPLYIVKRDALKTVIAGYPWFLDWGRDTLIVLRGLVADGQTKDALAILTEFGRFEKEGTLPNIIHGNTVGNYDTSDAPLWFCAVAADLIDALGAKTVLNHAVRKGRTMRNVIRSILDHYREGTPNGMKMDPESGLIYSPPHFTWMDTNYPAATPREGYPVEIQALWIAALRTGGQYLDPAYGELAELALRSLQTYFPLADGGLADCLRAKPGVAAADAEVEDAIRPNQLYVLSLGVLDGRDPQAAGILRTCGRLLVPGAIRSLADAPVQCEQPVWRDGALLNDPHNPYWGHYRGDEDTRRKPAYHNGTAWTLPFPLFAEALLRVYGKEAAPAAGSLLASAVELLNSGCLCQLPEICDGDTPHLARGCCAQAWGMSELLRVLRQCEAERPVADDARGYPRQTVIGRP